MTPWQAPQLAAAIEPVTARLRLRRWRDADLAPFAAMNADPAVMRYFAGLIPAEASGRSVAAWEAAFETRGWSNWALELLETGEFIGFTGLSVPQRVFAFSPCVEIGWRLAQAHWGQGYATEAARAALRVGFGALALPEIVSFTSRLNSPSRAVMHRLGMATDPNEDFDHPALPEGSALRPHCLYRLEGAAWVAATASALAG